MRWRGGERRLGLGGGLPWIQRSVRLLRCRRLVLGLWVWGVEMQQMRRNHNRNPKREPILRVLIPLHRYLRPLHHTETRIIQWSLPLIPALLPTPPLPSANRTKTQRRCSSPLHLHLHLHPHCFALSAMMVCDLMNLFQSFISIFSFGDTSPNSSMSCINNGKK